MRSFFYKNTGWFATAWVIIIFILCATPGQYIPSADWLDLLSFDKFVHASMFFILSVLWFTYALSKQAKHRVFVVIVLAAIMYGGLLEVMQAKYFSNRSADWKDFVANSFGCVVAFLLLKRIRRFFNARISS